MFISILGIISYKHTFLVLSPQKRFVSNLIVTNYLL